MIIKPNGNGLLPMAMPKDWFPTLVVVGKVGEHELAFQLNPGLDLSSKSLRLQVDVLRTALWDMEHNGVSLHQEETPAVITSSEDEDPKH